MSEATDTDVMEPRLWRKSGWIAKVIKNQDDDGWAVEMTRIGDSEASLVGPWTMGRDKKNPKPLDQGAFSTLVKTANEVLQRHEQAARARLHKSLSFTSADGTRVHVDFDIAPDENDPHAIIVLKDESTGEELRRGRVSAGFKLTASSAGSYLKTGDGGG